MKRSAKDCMGGYNANREACKDCNSISECIDFKKVILRSISNNLNCETEEEPVQKDNHNGNDETDCNCIEKNLPKCDLKREDNKLDRPGESMLEKIKEEDDEKEYDI